MMTISQNFRAARLGRALVLGLLATGAALVVPAGAPAPAMAQNASGNLFAPRLWVNDEPITEYEIAQRAQFLRLLNAPVDVQTESLKLLIEDRLRVQEARRMGMTMTAEQITAGMEEFASRANLTAEQFVAALEQGGVAAETFRDFVEAGAIWREVVRGRFASQVQISDAEVDEAINAAARQPGGSGTEVEYAEFLIPDDPAEIARLRATVDVCMDLYGVAKGLPESRLTVKKSGTDGMAADVARELSRMDPGEVSTALTRGGARLFLMLCNRAPVLAEPIDREVVRGNILNRKLEGLAEGYLEELRHAALIREP